MNCCRRYGKTCRHALEIERLAEGIRVAYLYNVYTVVDSNDGLWIGRPLAFNLPLDEALVLRNADISNRRVWYNGAGAPSESDTTDSPTAQGGGPGLDPDAAVGRVV